MKKAHEKELADQRQSFDAERLLTLDRNGKLEAEVNRLSEQKEKHKTKIRELEAQLATHFDASAGRATAPPVPTSALTVNASNTGVITDEGYYIFDSPATKTTTETAKGSTAPKTFLGGNGKTDKSTRLENLAHRGDSNSYDTEVDTDDVSATDDSFGKLKLKDSEGRSYRGRSRRPGRFDPNKDRLVKLSSASKILKIKLTSGVEIIDFLDSAARLEDQLNDLYGTDDEKLKIQLALNQCDEKVRQDAESVYEKCRTFGDFNLSEFFKDLFKLMYPAPFSSMDIAFRGLTQNTPTKGTIVEYSRKFRTICKLLRYDVQAHFSKFVGGLANESVKAAIRRTSTEGMNFKDLVSLAVNIENNLTFEKPAASRIFVGQDHPSTSIFVGQESCTGSNILGMGTPTEWNGELDYHDHFYLIMGVPLKRYLTKAQEQNIEGRCYNCLNSQHLAVKCKLTTCKFCKKETRVAKHYSLLCPLAPKSFAGLLKAKQAFREQKAQNDKVRFGSEYSKYEFESDEFSDKE